MSTTTITRRKLKMKYIYPLINPVQRLLIWEKMRGIWKNRQPDPIKELRKMRREWERKLPSLH